MKTENWDAWSLTIESLEAFAQVIKAHGCKKIIEFGSGGSTVWLAEFLASPSVRARLTSFVHEEKYYLRTQEALAGDNAVSLRLTPLVSVSDSIFESMFNAENPQELFQANKYPANNPLGHNEFYDCAFLPVEYDAFILDGPNSNGRSLAFPLLKHAVKFPCYALIDDCQDLPFIKYMGRVFKYDELAYSTASSGKTWGIYKLKGLT